MIPLIKSPRSRSCAKSISNICHSSRTTITSFAKNNNPACFSLLHWMVDVVSFMKLKQTAMTAKRLKAQGQRDILLLRISGHLLTYSVCSFLMHLLRTHTQMAILHCMCFFSTECHGVLQGALWPHPGSQHEAVYPDGVYLADEQ